MPKGRGANESRRNERQKKSIRQANTYDRDEKLEERTHHSKMMRATQGTGVKGPAVCRSPLHPHKEKT